MEIGQYSVRIMNYGSDNDVLRAMDLDLLKEKKDRAVLWLTSYRKIMTRAYNKKA